MPSGTSRGHVSRCKVLKCDKKLPFSETEAWDEARRMARQFNKPFIAYECNWCLQWHVGGSDAPGAVYPPTRRERELEETANGWNTIAAAWPQELRDKLNERLQHN